MNRYFRRLAALISASLAVHSQATVTTGQAEETEENQGQPLSVSVLNKGVSTFLAAHRSHSSHSSHRSHRSSSGRSAPGPSSPGPAKDGAGSDPLGQTPRDPSSYPPATPPPALSEKLKNEDLRKEIIMRIQLMLFFQGYYDGEIDGIMGPVTRAAILKYKKDKTGSTSPEVLDAETLNLFGISGF